MSEESSLHTESQRRELLAIVRQAVTEVLSGKRPQMLDLDQCAEYLRQLCGCFVTLHHRHGQLRGCIGTFEAARPLAETVIGMAVAATRDPRFVYANPVVLAEINDLLIELSILTPLQPMDNPLDLRLGTDGILIKGRTGGQEVTGCFLPQVPGEQGWDVEQTLSACCAHKMGLDPDAWRDPKGLTFHRFQAEVFGESAPGVLAEAEH